jgi:hypothetical protein
MNAEIPSDFFDGIKEAKPVDNVSGHLKPSAALKWYDGIIDDILANPGTTIKDTAARLGRNPGTISAIMNSDLFKSRWDQRRAQFSMALDLHLSQKLAQVAEKALEHTITQLDKKRDTIPLPILKDLALGTLDRLGYGPSRSESSPVNVNINNVATASPEALARARDRMKELELVANPREASVRKSSPLVAGPEAEEGEKD